MFFHLFVKLEPLDNKPCNVQVGGTLRTKILHFHPSLAICLLYIMTLMVLQLLVIFRRVDSHFDDFKLIHSVLPCYQHKRLAEKLHSVHKIAFISARSQQLTSPVPSKADFIFSVFQAKFSDFKSNLQRNVWKQIFKEVSLDICRLL